MKIEKDFTTLAKIKNKKEVKNHTIIHDVSGRGTM